MRIRAVIFTAAGLALPACQSAGRFLEEVFKERPPAPLDAFGGTSDARLDSLGALQGSFVGEGTSREVHLLSTDTGFVAALIRRYRPDLVRSGDPWIALARQGVVAITPSPGRSGPGPFAERALVGSPDGRSAIKLVTILVRGSSCGWRGVQAELIVSPIPAGSGLDLRGPVLGSFQAGTPGSSPWWRPEVPPLSDEFARELVTRTSRAMDSLLVRSAPRGDQPLTPLAQAPIEINTLQSQDAADVVAIRIDDERVRFAIALRERRATARGDVVVAATVMVWDRTGAWQQTMFRPTLLDWNGVRLSARRGWPPVFWRRLQTLSGFGSGADYLWMEQRDVEDRSTLWGVVEPRGNVVVAAAEIDGPCAP